MADNLWADPNQMWNAPESPSGQPQQLPNLRIPGMNTPTGAQDQYGSFLGGQPIPATPKTGHLNSATGHALDASGQVDDANIWNKVMPNRGRLANALGTGALLGGMIGQGQTIGENVSNVARAISQLPFARVQQQMQMTEPGVQRAQQLAGISKTQAEAEELKAKAGYESVRGQTQIEAERVRMQEEAAVRMEGNKIEYGWSKAPSAGISPGGDRWNADQNVWGSFTNKVNRDAQGHPIITKEFNPISTHAEMVTNNYGALAGGLAGHTDMAQDVNHYLMQYPQGKNGNFKPNSQEALDEAIAHFYQTSKVDPAIAAVRGGAGIPTRPANAVAEQRAINDASDKEAYAQMTYKNTNLKMSEARALPFFNPQAQSGSAELARVNQLLVAHNNRLADLKSQYDRMSDKDRGGRSFMRFAEENGYDKDKKLFKDQEGAAHQIGELKTFPNGKVGKWDGQGWVATQ